jgi:mannose-6-phosphate isomerase-like protein (cupin superfamily)
MSESVNGAVWSLADALAFHRDGGTAYSQFFEVPEMSAGIYALSAGEEDGQAPHVEDEIYYVISGKAEMLIDGKITPVETGATIFVAREIEHRFQNITEDMTILVIFAPRHDREESDRRRADQNA